MTDLVKISLIAATPPTLLAVGALVKLFAVGRQVDGRLTELLKLTRKSAHAEGVLQHQKDENGK